MIHPVLDQALTEPLRHGDLCRPTPSRRKNDAVAQIGWVLGRRFGGRCNVDAFDGPRFGHDDRFGFDRKTIRLELFHREHPLALLLALWPPVLPWLVSDRL